MNTALHVLILSLVALHVAALGGGGLALLLMRLFGHRPPIVEATEPRESIPEPAV